MQNALLWSLDGWLKCLGGNDNTGSDSCVGSSCVSVVGTRKDRLASADRRDWLRFSRARTVTNSGKSAVLILSLHCGSGIITVFPQGFGMENADGLDRRGDKPLP